MPGETDLELLLQTIAPRLRPEPYVYVTTAGSVPRGAHPVVTVREDEGLTLIVSREEAERLGLPSVYVAAWITLEVLSSLAAVGLTAVVAGLLASAGISVNVVAGFHHDHLFVPYEEGPAAIEVLGSAARRPRLRGL